MSLRYFKTDLMWGSYMRQFFLISFVVSVLSALAGAVPAAAENNSFGFFASSLQHYAQGSKRGDGTALPEKEKEEGRFRLSFMPNGFSVRSDTTEKIYDFKARQLLFIDHEKQTYLLSSLYAVPAFKIYEKKNREMMAEVMQKAGLPEKAVGKFELEMIFGAEANSEIAGAISFKTEDGKTGAYYKGEEVASYQSSAQRLSAVQQELFRKYLAYEHALHPAIAAHIAAESTIFSSLSYRNKAFGPPYLVERQYSLTETQPADGNAGRLPDSYKRIFAGDKRLNAVLELSQTAKQAVLADYLQLMEERLAAQDYRGVALVFFEYSIHYGDKEGLSQLGPFLKKALQDAPESSSAREMLAAIRQTPKTKEEAVKAVAVLEKMRGENMTHGYVLNIFQANYEAALGNGAKAIGLILESLQQNPFLAGAYKDLGDKYLQSYRMMDAWACWDRMREIAPHHGLTVPVNTFESQLRQQFPEYF